MAQYISQVGYGLSSALPVLAPFPIKANRAPTTADKGFAIGQLWVFSASDAAYVLTSIVNNLANWQLLEVGGGAGVFTSLTVNPGPINFTGVFTQLGTVNMNTSTAANTNIGTGTNSGTVLIGNTTTNTSVQVLSPNLILDSSAAGSVNLGNSLTTGNMTVGSGQTSGTIAIGGTGAAVGQITLGNSTGAQTLVLGGGAGVSTVQIANGIAGNLIQLGNGDNTAPQLIQIAGGASGADSTVSILAGNGTAGTQTFNVLTGTRAGVVNIGTGSGANAVTVGSTAALAGTSIRAGTGGLSLNAAGDITAPPATVSAAAYAATLNAQMGQATLTGQVLASGSTQVLTITNSLATTSTPIFVTVDNLGSNDAQLTVQRIQLQAGSFLVTVKNNGAAALNGDIHVNWWLLQ